MSAITRERIVSWWTDRPWTRPVAFAAAALIAALGLALDRSPYDMFVAGLLTGGLVMLGTALSLIPKKTSKDLSAGHDDEIETARALDRLGRFGWRPVHDRALGASEIDHIVIGPAGVFAIETVTLDGEIRIAKGRVSSDEVPHPEVARKARAASEEISGLVERTELKAHVSALVVFWGDFEQGVVDGEKVSYVAGSELVDWLHARPAKLSGAEIDQLVEAIADPPAGARLTLVS